MQPVQITNIVVKKFRIICTVQLTKLKYSNEVIKSALLEKMPTLAAHKCKNSKGKDFTEVLSSTSLAHVLEHMVIDIQSENTNDVLMGTTQWIDENSGVAKIELSYTDDVVCISAIKEASELLNQFIIQHI